jgi:membrane-bound metal-dependent hydrolase YbcI (DUF457 family)
MTPIAHAASGYLAAQAINLIYPNLGFNKPEIIIPVIIGATISDIDILFVKNVKNHRDSPFHFPFFWLTVLIVGYLIGLYINSELMMTIITGFGLGIFLHIFFDWLTVTEKGAGEIKLLYPFSNKKFAFKPGPTKTGEYTLKELFTVKYIKSHMTGRFLFIEIFLIVFSLLVFLLKSNILKVLMNSII